MAREIFQSSQALGSTVTLHKSLKSRKLPMYIEPELDETFCGLLFKWPALRKDLVSTSEQGCISGRGARHE